MTDDLDELKKQIARQKEAHQTLAEQTKPEWEMLKGLTQSIAMDGQEIEGQEFEWMADLREPCLVMQWVAAIFENHLNKGIPIDCRIRFDRKPIRTSVIWADDNPPPPVIWRLTPVPMDDAVFWACPEQWSAPISSFELSRKAAAKLVRYHLAYLQHYKGWHRAQGA